MLFNNRCCLLKTFYNRNTIVLRLDGKKGIVYNIPYMVPLQLYTEGSTTIIIKRLPVVMLKVQAPDRPKMPDWAILLHRKHEAHIFAGTQLPCTICSSARLMEGVFVDDMSEGQQICNFCLRSFHEGCADAASSVSSGGLQIARPPSCGCCGS